ncbi:MAG TPA: DUF4199 domain-containing protein [Cyclobacteriaceae bacterium]|nr:DUF4199 domain-containing protein [Cyclobacteriaceae bacterium]HMV10781.1 DUF4199 domain-containing protein [Cyclobacteriaceae bacterium]HMV88740.1 DUF4199 domain-containing protein [Cyclobacteriaceae bacterium]HMX02366.1 DUF4199 domain-containing protein [Cyclobacteriaceae bacterium]HMX51737.1 DUF4199 domain-containing protein [Cyclobacteriaceae bacterium]
MKKSPLVGISLRNGLIAGVLAVGLLSVMYYLGRHPLMVAPFLDFRILLLGIFVFFTLKEFRENHQNGELHFWQGMAGGFIMVMVAATVASALFWVFTALEKDFIREYVVQMTGYLKSFAPEDIERIGKDAFQRNLEDLPSTNGKQIAASYFIQSMVIGFFVTIILSVSLRKHPKSLAN